MENEMEAGIIQTLHTRAVTAQRRRPNIASAALTVLEQPLMSTSCRGLDCSATTACPQCFAHPPMTTVHFWPKRSVLCPPTRGVGVSSRSPAVDMVVEQYSLDGRDGM